MEKLLTDLNETELGEIIGIVEKYIDDHNPESVVEYMRKNPDAISEICIQITERFEGDTLTATLELAKLLETAIKPEEHNK